MGWWRVLNYDQVAAVIVTKGTTNLDPVLNSLPFEEVQIWDNSILIDSKIYGRYRAVERTRAEWIYTQDDDCIVRDIHAILAAVDRMAVVCNMPPERRPFYNDGIALVGWGCVFHRDCLGVLEQYLECWPNDELFARECDRVFTALNRVKLVNVPFDHLPHAFGKDRMGEEKRHYGDLARIRERIAEVKKLVAA